MDYQILITTIGVAFFTSLVAPYILQLNSRRQTKADALRKLMDVELTRWAGTPHKTYRKNQIELKAAVLIAGGSRVIADYYAETAAVARSFSDLDHEDQYFDGEGGIPTDIGECASEAASLLSQSLWVPYTFRFILRLKLKRLKEKRRQLKMSYSKDRGANCWKVRTI